jgi:Fe-Mn family superoxide dismutase
MPFELPALPYAKDALAPVISAETIDYHYGKHHAAYVANLNKLTEGTENADKDLEEVIRFADGGLFNNAAQVWNHSFYWNCMKPGGGGEPSGALAEALVRDFGSVDDFRREFKNAAVGQFGSGWAWLVEKGEKLEIMTTANADLPLMHGVNAQLTCDVWEHAYYIDFRNARPNYLDAFLEHLVNWDFVSSNMS